MKKKSLTLNQLIKAIGLRATLNKRLNIKILDVADLLLAKKNNICIRVVLVLVRFLQVVC